MSLTYKRRAIIDELTQDIIAYYNIEIPIPDIDEVVKRIGGKIKSDDLLSEY